MEKTEAARTTCLGPEEPFRVGRFAGNLLFSARVRRATQRSVSWEATAQVVLVAVGSFALVRPESCCYAGGLIRCHIGG